jgi:hypothetical protein
VPLDDLRKKIGSIAVTYQVRIALTAVLIHAVHLVILAGFNE